MIQKHRKTCRARIEHSHRDSPFPEPTLHARVAVCRRQAETCDSLSVYWNGGRMVSVSQIQMRAFGLRV